MIKLLSKLRMEGKFINLIKKEYLWKTNIKPIKDKLNFPRRIKNKARISPFHAFSTLYWTPDNAKIKRIQKAYRLRRKR
jgi:hypothetical protein